MELKEIIKPENLVYKRTPLMTDATLSYCPGCGHGTVHRLIMEVVEEMGIQQDTIGIAPVGCSVLAYDFMDVDCTQAAHGRAPAVATGIKRLWPEKYVFTYQGDGDLAAIGTAETIHACNRGEDITIFFVNNGIYGMTGGQMAPNYPGGDEILDFPLMAGTMPPWALPIRSRRWWPGWRELILLPVSRCTSRDR
jgi:2-oxoglutarate ferredoxin oxidoreductase subunit beta